MKFDKKILDQYCTEGKLTSQRHPTLPLTNYKYTLETQFSKQWNDILLRCRGLVIDDDGVVYANPMSKFFNVQEIPEVELPDLPYEVFTKYDGSCIQVFRYNGILLVTTLGSFQSDQSIIASHLLHGKYVQNLSLFEEGKTYVMELLVPENRIVINYGDETSLIMLAIRDNETDAEINPTDFGSFKCAERHATTIKELIVEMERPDFINKEGYVVRFSNGYRVKIKYSEYFKLHKIMTGITPRFVWEALKDNIKVPLEGVPDEFFKYITDIQNDLRQKFNAIEEEAKRAFYDVKYPGMSKKDFALTILQDYKRLSSILFKIWDSKEYADVIWAMIRPEAEKSQFQSFQKKEEIK
jgi:RNA ligase